MSPLNFHQDQGRGASLVVQWLSIHLAMWDTNWIPGQGESTCHGATKSMGHNC